MPKARKTCTECSIRRQKCDRQVPCDRCVKRGVPEKCTIEWPEMYDHSVHRSTPRRQTTARATTTPRATTETQDRAEDERQDQSVEAVSREDAYEPSLRLSNIEEQPTHLPADALVSGSHASHASHTSHVDVQREEEGSTLDNFVNHAAWEGFIAGSEVEALRQARYPQAQSCIIHTSSPHVSKSSIPNTNTTAIAVLQLQLPSIEQIWHLVNYHERYLLWYHGCYHGPTFRSELEAALVNAHGTLEIEEMNLQWVALLFSIMAGSLACAKDHMLDGWGFWPNEISKLSRQWYKATMACLNLAEYTSNHQIFSVHAITTLSMSAHTLGLSDDLSIQLGTALKIARSLNLDRLKYIPALDDVSEDSTTTQRHKVLRREIGRRLWSQLCVQEWFAIPFAESQCINLTDFTTTKPSNRNHITMELLPDTFPTYISYGNYLYDIARLMSEHHVAMAQSSTPFTKYEKVMEYDARMKSLARKGMPTYFHVTAPIDASWPEFIPWARRSLTVCFAHKILMIHRAFIRQSFTNPAFQVTRATCIAASKTILKEAQREQEEQGPIIWIDQACCIAAGITLCLDIIHRKNDDPEYTLHTELVADCVSMLRKFGTSMIATRGAKVLSTLLSERHKMAHPYVASRKRSHSTMCVADSASASSSRKIVDLSGVRHSLSTNAVGQQAWLGSEASANTPLSQVVGNEHSDDPDFTYKRFAELFPPQAGFSNSFLFDTLLDFSG